MLRSEKKCQHPEKLRTVPEECTPEQQNQCHGTPIEKTETGCNCSCGCDANKSKE